MLDPEDMKKIKEDTEQRKRSRNPKEVEQMDEVIQKLGESIQPLLIPIHVGYKIDKNMGDFILSSVITSLIMSFCSVDEAFMVLDKIKKTICDIDKTVNK